MAHMTQEEYKQNVKDVYKTTGILSLITIVEVALAIYYEFYTDGPRWVLMLIVSVASLVKAYWIMAVFMHVNHEKKGFSFSILFPFVFLILAVIAFSFDGAHWGENLRELLNW